MKTKQIFIVGFMLFAMFFGAGNLIFPPALGFNSGENFWLAIIGFIITGVGLPLIGMIVGSVSEGGYRQAIKEIHPEFSIIFLSAIYLTIGPFFAIPRTATTAYEMGVVPFLEEANPISLLLFTVFFFVVTFAIAVKPSQLSNAIGKFLTPALLVTIMFLITKSVSMYHNNPSQVASLPNMINNPLASGFTEGYLTMDTLASIAFSMVVLNSIKALGITDRKDLMSGTIKSALLAAFLLAIIYTSLGWSGNHINLEDASAGNQNLGTFLLIYIADKGFGIYGTALLGIIVFLACLTTSTGLIAAVSEYFNSLFPKISYEKFAILFTIISFVLANQGLDQVIKTSVPILSILYPISISIIVLIILSLYFPSPRVSLQIPTFLVTIMSFLSVLHRFGLVSMTALEKLPLFSSQLEWIPFLVIGYIVGLLVARGQNPIHIQDSESAY